MRRATTDPPPVLVLISGLQGTGKSTLATAVAGAIGAEQTLLARETLAEGRSVVVECVMAASLRAEWLADAAAIGAGCIVVECVCSDVSLHRRRVDERFADGDSAITWQRVLDDALTYVPAAEPDYIADAVLPHGIHVAAIAALVARP